MPWLQLLWLTILLLTLGGVAFGQLPKLAMNRATICLVGATLLVQSGAITYHEALQAIDLHTITLLLAMMILNIHLRMAGFFSWVAYHTTASQLHPRLLLALLMLVSATLSALFLNDTIVLAFTPLVLEVVLMAGLPPIPFLIGLATAANIGSVATLIGNPQNMLIGIASQIPFIPFLLALTPVALGSLAIAWLILVILYPKQLQQQPTTPPPPAPLSMHHTLLRKSLLATLLLLAALLSGMPVALAAISATIPLLITRRWKADEILQEVDWPVLLFFAALFIVTRAVETTGFSQPFLPDPHNLQLPTLAWGSLLLSNLVSNVPAVLLLKPLVNQLSWSHTAWLTLAMATTLAGNLTLLGSVANLIVAESARKQGVTLGFWPYLRAGLPITLATLLWGIYWLSRPA
ncbi:MAG: anion transporter [Magnetococcales bacterium]|nr:anion transporter [Magnetococcales bacterium]MBF0115793.1 anion transporter [Magnetococcales bacterium]